jgi:PhzF family phenazine biosynthesis protein
MTEVLRYTAFTTDPAGGNPAGVVLDTAGLDDAAMLRIAAEVGYSETAFATPLAEPGHHAVRYFSPLTEIAFCGHATIATAVALAERVGDGPLSFHTEAGLVEVTAENGTASLTSVAASSSPAPPELVEHALAALRWDAAELDPAFPPHVAFAGVRHLVLAAATRERLARLDYAFDELGDLMRAFEVGTVHLFWRGPDGEFHARDPFPVGGVVEDPATGAAAAAFGAYLRTIGALTPPARVIVHQGEDMGRPSLLTVDVPASASGVVVTGAAVPLP